MEIITKEEVAKLEFVNSSRMGASTPFVREAKKLEVGEGLVIKASEWPLKTAPGLFIQQSFREGRSKLRFSVLRLADKKGWVVVRKV